MGDTVIALLAAVADHLMTAATFASSSVDSEGEGSLWLLASGPVVGGSTYWMIYRYYRNTDKSHQYERETLIESQPITGADQKIDEVKGTSRSEISGNNQDNHRSRVQRLS